MNLFKSVIAICIISAFSCSQKKNEDHGHNHDQVQEMLDDTKDTDPATVESGSIASNYLALKDALVNSDAQSSANAASKLQSALEEQEYFNEAEFAKSITREESLEEQRKVFETLSIRIYELASAHKIEFNTLYKQYCPMAFDNKGAFWLSSSKEIRNPYFGDKMLKCGRVEETLARK